MRLGSEKRKIGYCLVVMEWRLEDWDLNWSEREEGAEAENAFLSNSKGFTISNTIVVLGSFFVRTLLVD